MKNRTGNFAAVSLAAVMVLAVGCGASSRLPTSAKDSLGQTSSAPQAGVAAGAPALGAAGSFAVLSSTTVISTGKTDVTGDLGVSPGTAVTGFPPGNLRGTLHANDAAAIRAQLDLATAYTQALGQSLGAIALSGNLGGQTLTPGVYSASSSLHINSGDLTLDAQGDPDAVFLFEIGSTLTVSPGRRIILTGGARASNIYWVVGSTVALDSGSQLKGSILAMASIIVGPGASVDGRLLTQSGSVTLDTNALVRPGAGASGPVTGLPRHM